MTFVDMLCGIGGCRLAFEAAGYRCVFDAGECLHMLKQVFVEGRHSPIVLIS